MNHSFRNITLANLIARSAYQMGKTPLLPIFAAGLGANDAFLGIIVSVSTFTGMVLKPVFGFFSDRSGRKKWLIIGALFFSLMPFTYWLVQTPAQLFAIRVIHGIATAIYGPVTLAFVSEQWPDQRAEKLGWFESARSAGYIIGPAAAGWMLLTLSPQVVFTVIGLISAMVFIPIISLPEIQPDPTHKELNWNFLDQIRSAFSEGSRAPAIWLSGGIDSLTFIATYALKAFLPIYALDLGINVAQIGFFFALQEGFNIIVKPFGGRLGDKIGYGSTIALGMTLIGVALPFILLAGESLALSGFAIILGIGQALIFPSTTALVSVQINHESLGAGMGLLGTMRNAGKVIGPVLGGLMISRFNYSITFLIIGAFLLIGGGILFGRALLRHRKRLIQPTYK